jgi:hypothetical protein
MNAPTPASRLRHFIEEKARSPEVIVHELAIGSPAPQQAPQPIGGVPNEWREFLSEVNGVRFEWQARQSRNDPGRLSMNGGGIWIPALGPDTAWRGRFLLVDGFPGGVGTYYRRFGSGPNDVDLVVGEPDLYPDDATFLCRNIDEFITLAIRHDLELGWADSYAEALRNLSAGTS